MIRVGIHGASGKMGKMIIECLKDNESAKLSVAYSIDGLDIDIKDAILTDDLETLFKNCDVVIDFSIKFGTKKLLEFAKNYPKPLCIGTTGLEKEEAELLKECSKKMPILYATNMSLGVAVLNKLAFNASKALKDFDIEITEMHHRYKKDAPSGTALTLGQSVAKARNLELDKVRVSGRDGLIGQRGKDEIAILALRGGDIVGRHRVGFYNEGEFIELSHTATSRATFANGAIKSAIWVSKKESGLYSIDDCLGI